MVVGIIMLVLAVSAGWYVRNTFQSSDPTSTWNNASKDLIRLDLVKPGVTVLPKFIVSGEARGTWFFEGSFPAEMLDSEGKQIALGVAEALGEWMTEDFVPFRVELNVGEYSGPATLVLHKDNPSGQAENDASLAVPIEVLDVQ